MSDSPPTDGEATAVGGPTQLAFYHPGREMALRATMAWLAVLAAVVAALTGQLLLGTVCVLLTLAPALVRLRVLALGVPARRADAEARVSHIQALHRIDNLIARIDVREWDLRPVQRVDLEMSVGIVLSEVLLRQLDDSAIAGLLRIYGQPRGSQAHRLGYTWWEKTLYLVAYFSPGMAAAGLYFASPWLAISGAIGGWMLYQTVGTLINARTTPRFDLEWARLVGDAATMADILEAAQLTAEDARQRVCGTGPMRWILGHLMYYPGAKAITARVRTLRDPAGSADRTVWRP